MSSKGVGQLTYMERGVMTSNGVGQWTLAIKLSTLHQFVIDDELCLMEYDVRRTGLVFGRQATDAEVGRRPLPAALMQLLYSITLDTIHQLYVHVQSKYMYMDLYVFKVGI